MISTGDRIAEVDALRGFAIILMVTYHLFFDLSYLGLADIDLKEGFWFFFPRAIGAMFLLLVGVSLAISDSRDRSGKKEGYWHHAKRGLLLAAVAALITIGTWIYPHEEFIQFGIIHLIAASTFIAPFFLRFKRMNALLGIIVIIFGVFAYSMHTDSHYLFWLGITDPGYAALDHYPVLPWFGLVLIGLFLGQTFYPHGKSDIRTGIRDPHLARITWALAYLGRNSLLIYITHQFVLFGILLGFKLLFPR